MLSARVDESRLANLFIYLFYFFLFICISSLFVFPLYVLDQLLPMFINGKAIIKSGVVKI